MPIPLENRSNSGHFALGPHLAFRVQNSKRLQKEIAMSSHKIKFIVLNAIVAAGLSASGLSAKAQTSSLSSTLLIGHEWSERTFFNVYSGFFRTQPLGAPKWVVHHNVGGYEGNEISCPETWSPTLVSGEPSCTRRDDSRTKMFVSEIRFSTMIAGTSQSCSLSYQALTSSEITVEQMSQNDADGVDFGPVPPFLLDMPGKKHPYSYSFVLRNPNEGVHYLAVRLSCGNPSSTFSRAELENALRSAGFKIANP